MLMLLFYCGSECYALECEPVVEIFPKVKLKPIPGIKNHASLVGLLNYGGKPVPVVDLCLLIEKRPSSDSMHTRLILVNAGQHQLALMAEKVTETAHLEKDQFVEMGLQIKDLPFLNGVYSAGDKSILYFDLDKLCKSLNGVL